VSIGDVVVHPIKNGRFVFYLVATDTPGGKPTHDDLTLSLKAAAQECVKRGVKRLCMPRIVHMDWPIARRLIEDAFADSGCAVDVYSGK
jgi:hypothetical protein